MEASRRGVRSTIILSGSGVLSQARESVKEIVIKNVHDLTGIKIQEDEFETLPYRSQGNHKEKATSFIFGLYPATKERVWEEYKKVKKEAMEKNRCLSLFQTRTDRYLLGKARDLAHKKKILSAFVTKTHLTGILTNDNPPKHVVIKKRADLEPFEGNPASGSNAMELSDSQLTPVSQLSKSVKNFQF